MNKLFEEVVEKVKNGTKFLYSIEYSGRLVADFYLKDAGFYFAMFNLYGRIKDVPGGNDGFMNSSPSSEISGSF